MVSLFLYIFIVAIIWDEVIIKGIDSKASIYTID